MFARMIAVAGVASSLLAAPAFAHHSFAMFDANKTATLEGTIKEYEWINPHAWIHMTVVGKDGKPQTWSFEGGSTGQLAQSGWTRDTLKIGDKVALGFHPLKDGSFGGQLLTIKLPDGKELCQGAACRAGAN